MESRPLPVVGKEKVTATAGGRLESQVQIPCRNHKFEEREIHVDINLISY